MLNSSKSGDVLETVNKYLITVNQFVYNSANFFISTVIFSKRSQITICKYPINTGLVMNQI
jgi:hypothetical protein